LEIFFYFKSRYLRHRLPPHHSTVRLPVWRSVLISEKVLPPKTGAPLTTPATLVPPSPAARGTSTRTLAAKKHPEESRVSPFCLLRLQPKTRRPFPVTTTTRQQQLWTTSTPEKTATTIQRVSFRKRNVATSFLRSTSPTTFPPAVRLAASGPRAATALTASACGAKIWKCVSSETPIS
jgi:hypothetical protein